MPVAIVLLGAVHLIVFGELWPSTVTSTHVFWLVLSGVIGIALGDLFLFHCLALIGPRLGELVMTVAPIITALLAWPILGETLGGWVILGIAVTLTGVTMVLADRRGNNGWPSSVHNKAKGVIYGLLGAAGQGTGLVLAKLGMGVVVMPAVPPAEGGPAAVAPIDPLSATLVRMIAGACGVWVIAAMRGDLGKTLRAVRDRRAVQTTCIATVLGVLGVWLSLTSVTYTKASIGATLMGVSPILILPLAYVAYGDRPGRIAVVGTLVAVLGVSCLFLAG